MTVFGKSVSEFREKNTGAFLRWKGCHRWHPNVCVCLRICEIDELIFPPGINHDLGHFVAIQHRFLGVEWVHQGVVLVLWNVCSLYDQICDCILLQVASWFSSSLAALLVTDPRSDQHCAIENQLCVSHRACGERLVEYRGQTCGDWCYLTKPVTEQADLAEKYQRVSIPVRPHRSLQRTNTAVETIFTLWSCTSLYIVVSIRLYNAKSCNGMNKGIDEELHLWMWKILTSDIVSSHCTALLIS